MYDTFNEPTQASMNFPHEEQTVEQRHLRSDTHRCFIIRHRYDSILNELRSVVEPYVECGYDAQQIKDELRKQGSTLDSLNNINLVISTIIGEQE